jgi:hypothetical protein
MNSIKTRQVRMFKEHEYGLLKHQLSSSEMQLLEFLKGFDRGTIKELENEGVLEDNADEDMLRLDDEFED